MEKVLRSLIQEKFDLDLRVAIEILSRRRDLVNEEKQEELIKLLQSRNISNIVPLGPGTNRYAFKLDGFVIKVATDHDGKIDNLKEFKMAKRLYPYVTKTYEVSENGTILVAEYIQPFESFEEMCKYADRIREILGELSSVYLIGDVGVTPNNFANWGLRVGSKDPVCLDFAYVYEVSSKLFLCRYCPTHSMLVPNKDFTELHCSNPNCGKKYLFEDIRAMIGNDIHRHEIGDLSEEGYKLTSSFVPTILTEGRSNYLAKKKEPTGPKKDDKPPEDSSDQSTENLGGTTMGNLIQESTNNAKAIAAASGRTIHINVTATPAAAAPVVNKAATADLPKDMAMINGKAVPMRVSKISAPAAVPMVNIPHIDEEDTSSLAFSGTMGDNAESTPPMSCAKITIDIPETPAPVKEPVPKPTIHVTAAKVTKELTKEQAKDPAPVAPPVEPVAEPEQVGFKFPPNIRDGKVLEDMISTITNRMKYELHQNLVFDVIKPDVRDKKMMPDTFYKGVQNAAFRSLITFCGFTEKEVPRDDGKGNKLVFTPPEDLYGEYYETLVFVVLFNRFLKANRGLSNDLQRKKYREEHPDHPGIQREWLTKLKNRIMKKQPIDVIGATKLADIISEMYCAPEVVEPETPEEVQEDPIPTEDDENTYDGNVVIDYRAIAKALFAGDPTVENMLKVLPTLGDGYPDEFNAAVINEFGMKHYNHHIMIDDPANVKLMKFNADVDGVSCTIWGILNLETLTIKFYLNDQELFVYCSVISFIDLARSLVSLDIDACVEKCINTINGIIDGHHEDTDDDYDDGDDDDEDEDYTPTQNLHVNVFPDDDFDIIKVCNSDSFGEINIPFYTELSKVKIENPPSMIDQRNGVWDWLTHMVPDMMFHTERPEYFLAVNTDDCEEDELHIVILDEDKGVYTMGIYYLSGIYMCDDDGNLQPNFDTELLAKINRVICEDTGYSRISHLRRSLSMTHLINTEEYIMEAVLSHPMNEDDDDEVPGDLSEAERAAFAVIMNGSKALPEDATQAQKEIADHLQASSAAAFGIPVLTEDENAGGVQETPDDTEEDVEEETFDVEAPQQPEEPKEVVTESIPQVGPRPIPVMRKNKHR